MHFDNKQQFVLIFLCGEWHPTLLWPNGSMGEDATSYRIRPRRRAHCIRRVPRNSAKGAQHHPPLLGPWLLWPRSPISATAELFVLYLLQFPSYDVIMSDADCTPGREPHSVAASCYEYHPRKNQVASTHSGVFIYICFQFVISLMDIHYTIIVCTAVIEHGSEIGSSTSIKLQHQFQSPKNVSKTYNIKNLMYNKHNFNQAQSEQRGLANISRSQLRTVLHIVTFYVVFCAQQLRFVSCSNKPMNDCC